MKRITNKLMLFVLMSMVGAKSYAHDIAVANEDSVAIYYTWVNNKTELSVSFRGSSYSSYSGEYSGNVNIPSSVTHNGNTYSVTSIDERAFYGCSGLTSVSLPPSITTIGEAAFWFCDSLNSVYISDLSAWFKIDFSVAQSNPLYYAHSLYCNGEEIKDLIIPSEITAIGERVFWGYSGLTSVTIPSSVTTIAPSAFYYCSGLKAVIVEEGNNFYDSRDNCNAIIETSTNTLICGCMNTQIPNSVTSIRSYAFYGCSGLTSVDIPSSVTSIGSGAFEGCSGLTAVSISPSVSSIESFTFSGCSGLTSVSFLSSLTSIKNYAFDGCDNITSVKVLVSDYSAFCNNNNLGIISGRIGKPVVLIDEGFNEINNYIIPNDVTSIKSSAFVNCSGLTSVTIPSSVTSIGSSAFLGCI